MMNDIRNTLNALDEVFSGKVLDQKISELSRTELQDYKDSLTEEEFKSIDRRYRTLTEAPAEKGIFQKAKDAWNASSDKRADKKARKTGQKNKNQFMRDFKDAWLEHWETMGNQADPNQTLADFVQTTYGIDNEGIKDIADNAPSATFDAEGNIENLSEIVPFIMRAQAKISTGGKDTDDEPSKPSEPSLASQDSIAGKHARARAGMSGGGGGGGGGSSAGSSKSSGSNTATNKRIVNSVAKEISGATKVLAEIRDNVNDPTKMSTNQLKVAARAGYHWIKSLKV